MKVPKPVKDMLNETVIYRAYRGEGDWNKAEFEDPVTIDKVRIDRTPVYSATTAGKVLLYNAVVFFYDGISTPLPNFKERSVLEFDGVEHVVQKVITLKDPYSNEVYSFELEVI